MKTYLPIAAAVALSATVQLVSPALARGGLGAYDVTQVAIERHSDYCEEDSLDVAGVPVDEMQQVANPTNEQRTALDELGSASVQAAQIVKASCPTGVSPTQIGRIDAAQQRVQAMLKAVNVIGPALAKFYNVLSDEQKARLNVLTQQQQAPASEGGVLVTDGSRVAGCRSRTIPDWQTAQISHDVRPTPTQHTLLNALQDAAAKARDILEASCQIEMPVTPPARLSAIERRLQSISAAIATVRGPLNDFYESLSDQQKSRFNMIGRTRASRRD